MTKQQAAFALRLSNHAIDFHIHRILKKLKAANMTAAVSTSLLKGHIHH